MKYKSADEMAEKILLLNTVDDTFKLAYQCQGGLRMEDQGVQSPHPFLEKRFSSFNCHEIMTIAALSREF